MDVELLVKELENEMSDSVEFETIDVSEDYTAAREYGVQATPTVVILGKDGSVLETYVGVRDKSDYEGTLNEALSG